jgi:hypothetical protein
VTGSEDIGQLNGMMQASVGVNNLPQNSTATAYAEDNLSLRRRSDGAPPQSIEFNNNTQVDAARNAHMITYATHNTDSQGSSASGATNTTEGGGMSLSQFSGGDLLQWTASTRPAVGAWLRYQYQNGQLTNVPLWPWPMNDRIMQAMVQSGYANRGGLDGAGETDLTKLIFQMAGAGSTPSPTPTLPPGVNCSTVTLASTLPAGFGSPMNFFTNPMEQVLQAYCDPSGPPQATHYAFVQKPASIQYHYTYVLGYQWNKAAQQWVSFNFACAQPLIGSLWCPSNATKQLDVGYVTPPNSYYIAHTCSYVNNQWKCGCRDAACATPYWQLQRF